MPATRSSGRTAPAALAAPLRFAGEALRPQGRLFPSSTMAGNRRRCDRRHYRDGPTTTHVQHKSRVVATAPRIVIRRRPSRHRISVTSDEVRRTRVSRKRPGRPPRQPCRIADVIRAVAKGKTRPVPGCILVNGAVPASPCRRFVGLFHYGPGIPADGVRIRHVVTLRSKISSWIHMGEFWYARYTLVRMAGVHCNISRAGTGAVPRWRPLPPP